MEAYVGIQIALGGLDQDMYNDWSKYSDDLLQVRAEMDPDSGGSCSDGKGDGRPAALKKLSVPGKRQLTRDEVVATRGYAEYHEKIFSDVSLETVVGAGGVEKWSAVARDKAAEDYKPSAVLSGSE